MRLGQHDGEVRKWALGAYIVVKQGLLAQSWTNIGLNGDANLAEALTGLPARQWPMFLEFRISSVRILTEMASTVLPTTRTTTDEPGK